MDGCRGRRSGLRLTGLLAVAIGMAAASPVGAVQLRYRLRPGQTLTYRVMVAGGALAQAPMAQAPMKVQFTVDTRAVQKVRTVSASGVADVEMTTLAGTMTVTAMGRTRNEKFSREVSRMKLSERGKLLAYQTQKSGEAAAAPGVDAAAGLDQADPLRALAGLDFPNRDLQPGDTWTSESRVDLGKGRSVLMKIASRLVALTEYKGRKCAKVSTTFEMPMDTAGMSGEAGGVAMKSEGKIAGQITTLFDTVAGQEVYADGSVIMLVKMQMSAAMDSAAAGQSVDMTSAMKMNVRQVLID